MVVVHADEEHPVGAAATLARGLPTSRALNGFWPTYRWRSIAETLLRERHVSGRKRVCAIAIKLPAFCFVGVVFPAHRSSLR
jgi:hypothetical protein